MRIRYNGMPLEGRTFNGRAYSLILELLKGLATVQNALVTSLLINVE